MKQEKEAGVKHKLVGFTMEDRGIPRHDYELEDARGNVIGRVTSGSQSPVLGIGIGMGYVDVDFAAPETEIFVAVRKRKLKAVVKKLPLISV